MGPGRGESGFGSNVRFLLLVQVVKERQQLRRNGKEGILKGLRGGREGQGDMALSLHGMIVCGRCNFDMNKQKLVRKLP